MELLGLLAGIGAMMYCLPSMSSAMGGASSAVLQSRTQRASVKAREEIL